jgi:hypothetical protein
MGYGWDGMGWGKKGKCTGKRLKRLNLIDLSGILENVGNPVGGNE